MLARTSNLQRSGCGSRFVSRKSYTTKAVQRSYMQLGIVAGTRQDLDAAEQWLFKSLEIFEKLNDEIGVADCYTHLGSLAHDKCDYEACKKWYEKALAIYEKAGS